MYLKKIKRGIKNIASYIFFFCRFAFCMEFVV